MKTYVIKAILRNYHNNKGLFQRLFGDHKAIKRLDELTLQFSEVERELFSSELYELCAVLLTEDTTLSTTENYAMKELRKALFGQRYSVLDQDNKDVYLAAVNTLRTEPSMFKAMNIKSIFEHANSVNAAKMVIALKRHRLLTDENMLWCLKVNTPTQCVNLFQLMNKRELLTQANKKRLYRYSNQVDQLKYVFDVLDKHPCTRRLASVLIDYPIHIAPICDFLQKLEAISPSLLSIETIRAIFAIARDCNNAKKNLSHVLTRVYRMFNFHQKVSDSGAYKEQVMLDKLGERKYKSAHYEMRVVADLRTEENLKILLLRALYIRPGVVHRLINAYKDEAKKLKDQASAQAMFDRVITELDEAETVTSELITEIQDGFFSKFSPRGREIPSPFTPQSSSESTQSRRSPSPY